MKFLIVRFSSIGDIVLTTPVIRALKLQIDNVEIHYCTKQVYHSILEDNPYIDQIHLLENSLFDLIKQLRAEKYDHIIDLHNNLRSFIVKCFVPGKASSLKKLNGLKWLMVNFKINLLPNIHIVDRYLETTRHLGVKKDTQGLDYFIPDKDNVENEWLPETHQKQYVAFAMGGKYATKRLPLNRMIELCDRINKPIILIGGTQDFETGEQIQMFFDKSEASAQYEKSLSELNKKTIIFNGCGKFSINQSASLIKNAHVVFTHDTGMMHIAAAFRKKIFSFWGNTIPLFGMYPYMAPFSVFENNKVDCRPCSKIGFNRCPKGHFKCMNDIDFNFYIP
ncbi:MAG: glycosyltransferase family 9 protein [Bacteroidetes bacterium]|nr:glycosyltransferase family 9 protein [Bacteroidota bacterium]MDA1121976.1 glycosyltransferase family 9 protein [Bacteroidota bacterium]